MRSLVTPEKLKALVKYTDHSVGQYSLFTRVTLSLGWGTRYQGPLGFKYGKGSNFWSLLESHNCSPIQIGECLCLSMIIVSCDKMENIDYLCVYTSAMGKCRISLATMFDLRQYCHLELDPTTKTTPVSRRIRIYRVTEMVFDFTKVDFHHWGTRYILWNSARQNISASLHITIFISTQDKITVIILTEDETQWVYFQRYLNVVNRVKKAK